jgi:hypothetical protein
MKKLISVALATLLLASTVYASESSYNEPFSDYSWGDSYYDSAEWMYENQVIQGYDDGTFRPDTCVNRAEFLKMLYIMAEQDLEGGLVEFFPDVSSSDWFYNYVTNAVDDDVVQGYKDGYFRPGICVNRAEAMKMAVILMLPNEAINSSAPLYYDDKIIADMRASAWYSRYARFLFVNRLMGTSHTTLVANPTSASKQINFYPEGGMSRAEVAEMLYRIKAYIDGGSPSPLPVVCTLEARPGLIIYLTSEAGQSVSGASIYVDGELADFTESNYSGDKGVYYGLYEQSGQYEIEIRLEGYDDYEFEINIDADVCHVVTKTLDIELDYENYSAPARNAQRTSDINSILNAIHMYQIDNYGDYPDGIKYSSNSHYYINNVSADLCSDIVPDYLDRLPIDPTYESGKYEGCSNYDIGYAVRRDASGRISVSAPNAELGEDITVVR